MADADDCSICLNTFNKSVRKPIQCLYCNSKTCRECTQTCLLADGAIDANCPSCHAVWGQEFIIANFTASFRTKEFKAHREKVLVDRERARLPETQSDAEQYKYARDAVKPIEENIAKLEKAYTSHPKKLEFNQVQQKMLENEREYSKLYQVWYMLPHVREQQKKRDAALHHNYSVQNLLRYNPSNRPIPALQTVPPLADYTPELKAVTARRADYASILRKLKKEFRPLEKELHETKDLLLPYKYTIQHYGLVRNTDALKTKTERQFVNKCPAANCAGFLNTSWECGLCNAKACKHCREHMLDPESHVCNPDTVETVKAIAKEAKPCPKCGEFISKISGCDQMWCIQCKTAFSWNTGKIETTVIHNPHYFQWMRESGQAIPRRDVPGDACNYDHRWREFTRNAYRISESTGKLTHNFTIIETNRRHIAEVIVRHYRVRIADYENDEWRRRLRVQRLINELGEDEWKIKLQRKEKAFHKERAQLQLIEMYANVCRDILGQLMDITSLTDETTRPVMDQWKQLKQFVDDECLKINKAYGCKTFDIFTTYNSRQFVGWEKW
jgi:hypothetical protein